MLKGWLAIAGFPLLQGRKLYVGSKPGSGGRLRVILSPFSKEGGRTFTKNDLSQRSVTRSRAV
jgi:hypothetical protein